MGSKGIFFSPNKKTAEAYARAVNKKENYPHFKISTIRLAKKQIPHGSGWKTWEVEKNQSSVVPKGFSKKLELGQFVYYMNKNDDEDVRMYKKTSSGLKLVSDNYFAVEAYMEDSVKAVKTGKYRYISKEAKEGAQYLIDDGWDK